MDTISKQQRSANMRAIRSKNTKPEVYFRKLLFSRGFRYRLHCSSLPGKPDLFFRKYNTAVFVNGCFWHHHQGCHYGYMPKTRQEYWISKFERNMKRDKKVCEELQEKGVRQLIIWECLLKEMKKDPELEKRTIDRVESFLKQGSSSYLELPEKKDLSGKNRS